MNLPKQDKMINKLKDPLVVTSMRQSVSGVPMLNRIGWFLTFFFVLSSSLVLCVHASKVSSSVKVHVSVCLFVYVFVRVSVYIA
jgi:hypothetical protein